jgi:hypothetical protein
MPHLWFRADASRFRQVAMPQLQDILQKRSCFIDLWLFAAESTNDNESGMSRILALSFKENHVHVSFWVACHRLQKGQLFTYRPTAWFTSLFPSSKNKIVGLTISNQQISSKNKIIGLTISHRQISSKNKIIGLAISHRQISSKNKNIGLTISHWQISSKNKNIGLTHRQISSKNKIIGLAISHRQISSKNQIIGLAISHH